MMIRCEEARSARVGTHGSAVGFLEIKIKCEHRTLNIQH
jgi:hypothetical protein